MMRTLPVFAALLVAFLAGPAIAQSQDAQQACESDVYNLCGDAIPDQDKIVVCLRKHWSKVSKECRHVMATYAKSHKGGRKSKSKSKSKESGSAGMGNSERY